MNPLLIAEINMTMVVMMQILLPIGFALWVRKQSHRFQSNAIKVMLVLGLGSTPLVLWWLNSVLTQSSP
ncbi:MAG TPA: hypothetical protein DEQ73_03055 [Phycisphaerales bacterium]|jgi:predicted RNA binding protein YcfA (HicA-like mRNA interferase family)|nr:MAG: hypothetical protein CBB84_006605 [Phycisphaera sp. TMED24]HCD29560.1 hypothetical protein [Phycisphaerales bacterium]